MAEQFSPLELVLNASPVVQAVLAMLLIASVISWAIMLRKRAELKRARVDADRFEVRVEGHALALTPVEFRLLRRLMEKPGKVYSRGQLLDASYEDHRVVSDRTVDSHVRNLRRKFSELGHDPIESVYGVGFRFEPARER